MALTDLQAIRKGTLVRDLFLLLNTCADPELLEERGNELYVEYFTTFSEILLLSKTSVSFTFEVISKVLFWTNLNLLIKRMNLFLPLTKPKYFYQLYFSKFYSIEL